MEIFILSRHMKWIYPCHIIFMCTEGHCCCRGKWSVKFMCTQQCQKYEIHCMDREKKSVATPPHPPPKKTFLFGNLCLSNIITESLHQLKLSLQLTENVTLFTEMSQLFLEFIHFSVTYLGHGHCLIYYFSSGQHYSFQQM